MTLQANIGAAHPRATHMTHPAPGPTDPAPALGVVVLPVAGPNGVFVCQLLCVGAVGGYAEGVSLGPSQGSGALPGVIWEHGLLLVAALKLRVEVPAHGFRDLRVRRV